MTARRKKLFRGFRLHIGFFGRRNAGKSSLLNAMTRQNVSIVSDQAGTTTDPVEKPMELLPLGPVLFIDTAGIDDEGALGELRVQKTRRVLDRVDLGVIVTESGQWGEFEEGLLTYLSELGTPVLVVHNKVDLAPIPDSTIGRLVDLSIVPVETVATTGQGLEELRQGLLTKVPSDFMDQSVIAADLVGPGEMAVLVVPIDKEAPKGRLILPQVQTIRDLLDGDAYCMVVKERELRHGLEQLKRPPKIVITDSQAFLKVSADTPPDIMMTSFSILFSRLKGDLATQALGAVAIDSLATGDRVLIAESCTHHPIADDIGQVKIPRWLTQYVGGKLEFTWVQGHDYPDDLAEYKLVIHCGACMFNRRAMVSRIFHCRQAGVPVTNYGLAIAYCLGIFERALKPFPAVSELYKQAIHAKSGD
jgi:[FeFe] hydrogenase H-cluster maturation GTPase HydF